MTGFGEARSQAGGMAVAVEVRTINSRHFKLSYRASEGYAASSRKSKRSRAKSIRRGTVQLNLRVDRRVVGRRLPHQHRRARKLSPAARSVHAAAASGTSPIDLRTAAVAARRQSTRHRAAEHDPRDDWPAIEPVIREALAAIDEDAGRGRRRARRRPGPQRPADRRIARRHRQARRPRSRSRINRGSRSACSKRSRS